MTVPHIELLWFEDCPNHEATERLLRECLLAMGVEAPIHRIEVADEATGTRLRFPGSPTVRIDGVDVEPGWEWSGDGTPRCRLYATSQGLRGIPEASWIDARLRDALGGVDSSGGDR
ncbi:MAG: thioredoxin family protein [Dehalococcoidia bacterium]